MHPLRSLLAAAFLSLPFSASAQVFLDIDFRDDTIRWSGGSSYSASTGPLGWGATSSFIVQVERFGHVFATADTGVIQEPTFYRIYLDNDRNVVGVELDQVISATATGSIVTDGITATEYAPFSPNPFVRGNWVLSGSPGVTVDSLTVNIVPEPTSAALLAVGLGLVALRRRS